MEYSHELSEVQLQLTRDKEAESMKVLHELSVKDALTQLYNRRYLHQVFDKEFQTAKRHEYYFAFFILDIDYFKQYNDTYGHQKGDEVLCALADALRLYMRRSEDMVFRLGGEEFCGISVSDDESKIQAQLKVLVHAVESLQIEHKSSEVSPVLTTSLGVKIIKNYGEYNFDRLYKEADEALYKAKEEGRNQIQFA
jgi:diguanylate cyclase (GGDEF)-like protein